MAIECTCPGCGQRFRAADAAAGKLAKCPKCGAAIRLPEQTAAAPLDPARLGLRVNGFLLYENGAPAAFDAQEVSRSMRANRDTHIELWLGEGTAGARFWTCDLTAEYLRINADYHT